MRKYKERKVENSSLLDLSLKRRNFKKGRNATFSDPRLTIKNASERVIEEAQKPNEEVAKAKIIKNIGLVDRNKDPPSKNQELKKLRVNGKKGFKDDLFAG
uniref:Uncharacterized protein n=1 Tax=Strongyloides venezuelensis TaxID=75913 RepID=A0A0K0F1B0_STRVS